MMIGGTDIVLERIPTSSEQVFSAIRRLVGRVWQNPIVEDGDTGELLPSDSDYRGLREIMIYKNAQARESWEQLGADSSNANTMIHVIVEWDRITISVDDKNAREMNQILALIEAYLPELLSFEDETAEIAV